MAHTPSTMLELGTQCPDFSLSDMNGKRISNRDFEKHPLLVAFICNHCPYVKNIIDVLARRLKDYQDNGVRVVTIMSNDYQAYPNDKPEEMKKVAETFKFTFPYLLDESQEVAKKFRAACTPDFFLFDSNHKLVYRGQFDDSRPGNDEPVTGRDLSLAVEHLLTGEPISQDQKPSVGCNIKWKPGNQPDYF